MSTFGRAFRVTTFGESHGAGVGCIIDGVPPCMPLTESDIQPQLDRRRPGQSALSTPRNEPDRVVIQSGTENGLTLGSPVGLFVANRDQRPVDYSDMCKVPRPSHADYTYMAKYGIKASSGGGRSSARETLMRVAAGAVAEKWLRLKVRALLPSLLPSLYGGCGRARAIAFFFFAGHPLRAFFAAEVVVSLCMCVWCARCDLSAPNITARAHAPLQYGIEIVAWVSSAGDQAIANEPDAASVSRADVDASAVRCPDADSTARMVKVRPTDFPSSSPPPPSTLHFPLFHFGSFLFRCFFFGGGRPRLIYKKDVDWRVCVVWCVGVLTDGRWRQTNVSRPLKRPSAKRTASAAR
ncbi:chorismate synthase [Pandoravirus japonicus]|uniref:chorismate synthase n=1 Tax=Pandoravirus japonicus TaxID=2823154 RepID=A0A811BPE0_9VIRU|nr:chorismate synthase [Pandoravirus japonicus]